MAAANERKVVLVTRKTRLEELVAKYHTLGQARFYIEHLGADFTDYVQENLAYGESLHQLCATLRDWGRHQVLDRALLPNFVFAPDDIVIALGQDGLVANTMKYLEGQPLIGVNPEPRRWDGSLLPFEPSHLDALLRDVARGRRPTRAVTMAQARLSDGQTLRAVNDLFIGPRSHTSALYDIALGDRQEQQSSSGVIVSTGLGSTAWLKSVMTGSMALAGACGASNAGEYRPMDWDTDHLTFAVREPFLTQRTQAGLVHGQVTKAAALRLRSRMPENGVIFSDGMESDFLRFTAGIEVTVSVAQTQGVLVH
ncbi:sugar kinase [Roseateles sp. NT4]|uniref:sugar kinase n=1 Tax=Roseateles sp. NT4 TaxID=3453715 RepID=UPI003EEDE551